MEGKGSFSAAIPFPFSLALPCDLDMLHTSGGCTPSGDSRTPNTHRMLAAFIAAIQGAVTPCMWAQGWQVPSQWQHLPLESQAAVAAGSRAELAEDPWHETLQTSGSSVNFVGCAPSLH